MMEQRRRLLMTTATRKKYKIKLQGLSTVSHTPTLENPCTITDTGTVYTAGVYTVTLDISGHSAVYESPHPLRCTYKPTVPYTDTSAAGAYGNIGLRDYIEITENSVKLYKYVERFAFPSLLEPVARGDGTVYFTGFTLTGNYTNYQYDIKGYNSLSTHFKPVGDSDIQMPYYYASNGLWIASGRAYFIMPRSSIGASSSNTNAECAALYATYIAAQQANLGIAGCNFYSARATPVVTDLTGTTFGQQALIALSKYREGVTVNSNADILIEEVE